MSFENTPAGTVLYCDDPWSFQVTKKIVHVLQELPCLPQVAPSLAAKKVCRVQAPRPNISRVATGRSP